MTIPPVLQRFVDTRCPRLLVAFFVDTDEEQRAGGE